MSNTLIWHDTRLAGYPAPSSASKVVTVDRSTALSNAIAEIGNFANGQGRISRLSIMCHGFTVSAELPSEQRSATGIGGGGLQLTRDTVGLHNVARLAALNGWVEQIVVFACSAAFTHPDLVGSSRDGQRLFGEMALHTGAVVFAADATQWYTRRRRHASMPNTSTDIIDFRQWEGNLWRFSSDGSPATIVESYPAR